MFSTYKTQSNEQKNIDQCLNISCNHLFLIDSNTVGSKYNELNVKYNINIENQIFNHFLPFNNYSFDYRKSDHNYDINNIHNLLFELMTIAKKKFYSSLHSYEPFISEDINSKIANIYSNTFTTSQRINSKIQTICYSNINHYKHIKSNKSPINIYYMQITSNRLYINRLLSLYNENENIIEIHLKKHFRDLVTNNIIRNIEKQNFFALIKSDKSYDININHTMIPDYYIFSPFYNLVKNFDSIICTNNSFNELFFTFSGVINSTGSTVNKVFQTNVQNIHFSELIENITINSSIINSDSVDDDIILDKRYINEDLLSEYQIKKLKPLFAIYLKENYLVSLDVETIEIPDNFCKNIISDYEYKCSNIYSETKIISRENINEFNIIVHYKQDKKTLKLITEILIPIKKPFIIKNISTYAGSLETNLQIDKSNNKIINYINKKILISSNKNLDLFFYHNPFKFNESVCIPMVKSYFFLRKNIMYENVLKENLNPETFVSANLMFNSKNDILSVRKDQDTRSGLITLDRKLFPKEIKLKKINEIIISELPNLYQYLSTK